MRYSKLMKYIGIDYGTKKVGIAVGDGNVALPKAVLPNNNELISRIGSYIAEYAADTIVVGKSLTLSGGENKLAEEVRGFIEGLKVLIPADIQVHYIDERYTTKQARTLPIEGLARGDVANKRSGVKQSVQADAQAAALILQAYLDKQADLS